MGPPVSLFTIMLPLFGVPWWTLVCGGTRWPPVAVVVGTLVFAAGFVALPVMMVAGTAIGRPSSATRCWGQAVTIPRLGSGVTASGASGVDREGANLDAALAGADPALPVLLLAHQPKQVTWAVNAGVDLQISGHTHGGQIWPFNFLVRLDQPVVAGLSRHGERTRRA